MHRQNSQPHFRIGLLSVLLITAPFALLAQTAVQTSATTPVVIRVTDPTGVSVPHARIRLVPSPENAPAKLETDDKGQLSIELAPGPYALFISAGSFKKIAQHLEVVASASNGSAAQMVAVRLEIPAAGAPVPVNRTAPALENHESHLLLTADPYHSPVALSPADFRALPHTTITVHNSHTDANETYSGVLLATLLAKVNAPLGKDFHEEALTSYLIATGSDGYSVLFSLAEIDPSFHAGQVLVADTRDGQPLAKNGPFQLIVSDDKRPARWVHNLDSITLTVQPAPQHLN
jgi:hypothetical protein